MDHRGTFFLLLWVSGCWAFPLSEDDVDKRTLDDPPTLKLGPFNPFLTPYGIYPGIKPLRPIPPAFFLNRFATPEEPLSPISALFKSKKDEFLNKLFDQLSIATDAPDLEVRSVVDAEDEDATLTPTPTPKIDPSVFISKKFDFLSKLFKALNTTTTPAPTVEGETIDPLATTVKPTIVPPGFWVPIFKPPKPPKPPKPSKSPKPEKLPKPPKSKDLLLSSIDEALLKSLIADLDLNTAAADSSGKATRKISFLDAFLHRVTTPEPDTEASDDDSANLETRSLLFPPGYWIPPYIYAAKMGIYLDKIFDTINSAAAVDETDEASAKRSVDTATNASLLILTELSQLKNDLLDAFAETAAKGGMPKSVPPASKSTPKAFKKPFWGPKTTPVPDPAQKRIELLSGVFDKLAEVQLALLNGEDPLPTPSSVDGTAGTTIVPPSFWLPDPTAADIGAYYKDKTQEFLNQLYATPDSTS